MPLFALKGRHTDDATSLGETLLTLVFLENAVQSLPTDLQLEESPPLYTLFGMKIGLSISG
jgi:hypothetical protein